MPVPFFTRLVPVYMLLAGSLFAPLTLCASDSGGAAPAGPDPARVFAYQGDAVLTQQELDAAFSLLPEEQRLAFIRDGAKVDQLVMALLKRKVVAAAAEKDGFDREPLVADQVQLAAQKELAEAWLDHVVATAPEADYEAIAHEDYLANPDDYRTETVLDVSQILIDTKSRSDDEALELARKLWRQLEEDPSSFNTLVETYSDDPAKSSNGGRYPEVHRGQMVAAFEQAAFALKDPGQISSPVKSEYGYHLIRLNKRSGGEIKPFEEIRAAAVEKARENYLERYRQQYLQALLQDPIVIPDGAVEIMAKRHFGENLELAPDFGQ